MQVIFMTPPHHEELTNTSQASSTAISNMVQLGRYVFYNGYNYECAIATRRLRPIGPYLSSSGQLSQGTVPDVLNERQQIIVHKVFAEPRLNSIITLKILR